MRDVAVAHCVWERTPSLVQALAHAGMDTAPRFIVHILHRVYGVGGHHETATLITVVLAASAAVVCREVVDGENAKFMHNCSTLSFVRNRERNVLSGSRVHSALKHHLFRGVNSI